MQIVFVVKTCFRYQNRILIIYSWRHKTPEMITKKMSTVWEDDSATVDEKASRGYLARETFWSEGLAVGSEEWVGSLLPNVRNARIERIGPADSTTEVAESRGTYAVYASKRDGEAFWRDRVG